MAHETEREQIMEDKGGLVQVMFTDLNKSKSDYCSQVKNFATISNINTIRSHCF